jgi:hypothetical protein
LDDVGFKRRPLFSGVAYVRSGEASCGQRQPCAGRSLLNFHLIRTESIGRSAERLCFTRKQVSKTHEAKVLCAEAGGLNPVILLDVLDRLHKAGLPEE